MGQLEWFLQDNCYIGLMANATLLFWDLWELGHLLLVSPLLLQESFVVPGQGLRAVMDTRGVIA